MCGVCANILEEKICAPLHQKHGPEEFHKCLLEIIQELLERAAAISHPEEAVAPMANFSGCNCYECTAMLREHDLRSTLELFDARRKEAEAKITKAKEKEEENNRKRQRKEEAAKKRKERKRQRAEIEQREKEREHKRKLKESCRSEKKETQGQEKESNLVFLCTL